LANKTQPDPKLISTPNQKSPSEMKRLVAHLIFGFLLALSAHNMQAQTYTMSNGTVNTCSGTFLDPGGAGAYADNSNFTQTFCSNNGQPIYLQFTQFSTESGFDFVTIYNGPNTASPVMGTYAGTSNPGTVAATGTCITIRFTSDGSVTYPGWSATIGCGTPPPPPPPPAGSTCANPNSFCGQPISYPAGVNNGTAPAGPAYGCLGSEPNPAWFNMQVSVTGPMNFSLSAGADIDFIIWGPFTGPTNACMAGLTSGNIVSCSYSASSNEFPSIPNAVAGQWYMLLITNFSNQPVTINFNQTGGSGQANCNILCNITNMTGTAGACNPANNTFGVTGTITTTSPPSSGTLTISSSCGGTPLVLNPPFSTSYNYNLTGIPTGTGNCTITAAYSADPTCTRSVTVTAPPPCTSCTVTASNTGPYCPNGTINLTAGTATVVPTSTLTTTYSWSGPNSYTATGQSASIPVATTGMNGVYTVTATTGTTTCTATTSVTVNPSPTVTVNSPTICIGATANLTAGGAVNYNWSAGTTPATGANVAVTPTVTTTYTVTGFDANGCVGTAVSTVTVNSLPVVTAGSATICVGDTATLTAGGATTYTWSAGPLPSASPTPTVSPAATTSYTVTGTDANSCVNTATCTVTVNPLPVVTATSATVCATFPATITAAGANTYTWSPGPSPGTGPSVTVTPAATQSYTVTGTDGNGCENTAVSTVTVNVPPVISVPSATICINFSTPLTANDGTLGYTWDPPTGLSSTTGTTVTANPTVTTTYTVIGTDGNGCRDTTTTTVTVNTQPAVDAGPQDTVCLGFNTVLNATGGVSYAWTADPTLTGGATANPTVTPTVTTTYTATITDINGCSATDSVTVLVPPTFSLTTLAVPAVCNGQSNGSVAVTPTPAQGANPFAVYTYLWSNSSQAQIVTGLPAGPYSVDVTDLAGCLQSATVTVTEPTALVATQAGMTPALCNGSADGTATVSASGGTVGSGYTYSWAPAGGTGATTTPVAAGTYTVTVTDANFCTTTLNSTISEPTPVTLTAPAPVTICQTQTTALTASATGGTSPYTYTWDDGSNILSGGTVNVSPMTTTTYSITVKDSHNCTATNQPVTVVVTVNPSLAINPVPDAEFCLNDFVIKDVSGTGGNGMHSFTWSPMTGVTILNGNGSSAKLAPTISTVYTVTIHDNCGTPAAMTSFSVTVNPIPQLTIATLPSAGCSPLTVGFTGTSTPASATCNWSLGGLGTSTSCTPTQTFVDAGTYTINYDVVDVNGCTNSATSSVTVYPIPEPGFTASPQPTTIIDPVISFTDISFGNIASQTWYFYDSLGTIIDTSTSAYPSHTYMTAGTYSVTLIVVSNQGCIDSVTQEVYVTDYYALYVPNAFTPDGDEINDEFRATGTGIKAMSTTIYDRWGGKIFTTSEMNEGWNGRDGGGNKVAKGVYIYSITATNYLGEKKQYTGHVTVVR
jgi:gliding motility-associated-like protein